MTRKFSYSLVLLFLFCIAPAQGAAPDDISVKAEVDRAFLTIGDPVTYTITAAHAPGIKILSSIPAPDSSILEIKKIEDINTKEGKNTVTGRRFTLTTYKLGEFVLDPVTIKYQKGNGPEKSLETSKIYLTVKSVAEGEPKQDIRDVKSVVPLTVRLGWILIALGLIFLVIITFVAYQAFRKKAQTAQEPEIQLSPADEALNRLRELFDSDLLRRGFVKLYYLQLSEILRIYFEKRYGILAVESTTFEIMRAMKGLNLDRSLSEKIQHVLASADLAKFAKWIPSPTEALQINKRAEEIIRESTPVPTEPPPPEAPHGV